MIHSLELENFKGVAARQRIEFAPITLLFGANSAGKSTILHALVYLHELLERGSADVDRTELAGHVLELGGFARLVHRHESERVIVLRAEFATPGGLERFGRDLTDFPFPDLDDEVESAWLALTIRFLTRSTFRGAIVERAVIGVNGVAEPLVWLEVGATLREDEALRARINMGHPVLASAFGEHQLALVPYGARSDVTEAWEAIAIPEEGAGAGEGGGYGGGSGTGTGAAVTDGSGFGNGRSLPVFALVRGRLSALPSLSEPLSVSPFGGDTPENTAAAQHVRTFLEMAVIGTTSQLANVLRELLFIGPLRAMPPRGYRPQARQGPQRWADGLAAWDAIAHGDAADVGRWMKRLGTGYDVSRRELIELPAAALDVRHELADITDKMDQFYPHNPEEADADEFYSDTYVDIKLARHQVETLRKLQTSLDSPIRSTRVVLVEEGTGLELEPQDVGIGVSQLLPVVAAAVLRRRTKAAGMLVCIEQPELHVHPRVQVELADLFVTEATALGGRAKQFLIETHSEHLILRLLRRIRETTDKELADDAPAFREDKLSVLYVEASPDGVRVRRLRVDERGEFKDPWPKGFFDERYAEVYGE